MKAQNTVSAEKSKYSADSMKYFNLRAKKYLTAYFEFPLSIYLPLKPS